jgi:hypothetical protein
VNDQSSAIELILTGIYIQQFLKLSVLTRTGADNKTGKSKSKYFIGLFFIMKRSVSGSNNFDHPEAI